MRPMILVLVLSTFAFFFQGALAGSSYASSQSQSSSESRSGSSRSSSSSWSSSSSGSSSSGSSGSASARASAGSGSSGSGKPAPPPAPKEVGIKCIGFEDTHIRSKDENADIKYPPFKQDCPKDSYCATFYLNVKENGEYAKIRYSGCPSGTMKNQSVNFCDEDVKVTVTVNGNAVRPKIDCCDTDYCNQHSAHASMTVRTADMKNLGTDKKQEEKTCAASVNEFDLDEELQKLREENQQLKASQSNQTMCSNEVKEASGIALITLPTLLTTAFFTL